MPRPIGIIPRFGSAGPRSPSEEGRALVTGAGRGGAEGEDIARARELPLRFEEGEEAFESEDVPVAVPEDGGLTERLLGRGPELEDRASPPAHGDQGEDVVTRDDGLGVRLRLHAGKVTPGRSASYDGCHTRRYA